MMATRTPMVYGRKTPGELWKIHLASVDAWKEAVAARNTPSHAALTLKAIELDGRVADALFPRST